MAANGSLGRKIGIASLIVMGSVLLSRVLGVVRQSYLAYLGGAGSDVDAYNFAFQLPDLLNHVVAGGYLSVTFIPIFTAHLERGREDEGWRVFSIVVTVCTAFLVALTAVAMVYTPDLVTLMAPGLRDQPETLVKSVRMTRIILPGQICFFTGGIFMAVQYAKGHFLIPALAPLIYNAGIILGGVALGPTLGVEGFCWGVLGGAFVGQLVLQAIGARRLGMRYRPGWNLRHPDFSQFLLLTLPLVLGLSMTFSVEIFFKYFGSTIGPGTVSSLNYALRLVFLLVALFGQAAGVASFPFLAKLHAQGKLQQLAQTLDQTIRRYLCLVIPASALMFVLAEEIVVVVYQRGSFRAEDVPATAEMMRIFVVGAFAMAALNLVVRGFYARKNTWLPAVFGTLAVLASIPLYQLFGTWFRGPGVALGVSVSALIQSAILYTVWNRWIQHRGLPTYLALGRAMLMTLPLTALAWALQSGLHRVLDSQRFWPALGVCALVGTLFAAGVVLLAKWFRVREISEIADVVWAKLGKALAKPGNRS